MQTISQKLSLSMVFGMGFLSALVGAGNSGADSLVKLITNWGSAAIQIIMVGLILVALYKVVVVIWESR